MVRHPLSCTLRRTDKEERVDLHLALIGIVKDPDGNHIDLFAAL